MRYRVVQCDCGYTATEQASMSCFVCPKCGNRDCHPDIIREFDADENVIPASKLPRLTPKAPKPDLKSYGPKGIRNIRKD